MSDDGRKPTDDPSKGLGDYDPDDTLEAPAIDREAAGGAPVLDGGDEDLDAERRPAADASDPAAASPPPGSDDARRELHERARSEMRRIALVGLGGLVLLAVLVWDVSRRAPEEAPADVSVAPPPAEFGPLPDFTVYSDDVAAKKANFFGYLLPIVEYRNAWVLEERAFLDAVHEWLSEGRTVSADARPRLEELATRYRVKIPETGFDVAVIDELLLRADVIPPSLALAQAASESAWGTSRFARRANNLFGEWCFTEGCGVIPQRRPAGAKHEVELFEDPADAVDSYFRNLNSHPAYAEVRELRAAARAAERPPTGPRLAEGLERYSERGDVYIEEIRAIIRVNDLDELDVEPTELASFVD